MIKQGIGGRAAGMGGAYSAVADDASAVFYNPAGLAEPGFGFTYGSNDSQQVNNNFGYSFIKLGFLGYSQGSVINPNGDLINYTAFGFGNRSGWLNWGTNYKGLDWTLTGTSDSGWTADIGLLMRITPTFKIGLVAQDVLTTQSRLVPASGRLGLAFKPNDGPVLLAADAEIFKSGNNYGHLGVEVTPIKGFALRAGLDRGRPTAGSSLDLAAFTLDYAALFPPDGKNIQKFEAGAKFSLDRERPFSLIKPKEFALLDISGAITGGTTQLSLFGGVSPGLDSILENIRAVEKDSSIDGIMIRLGGFSGGLGGAAVVQEIRAELLRAKAKGKKIVVYIEGSALGDEYYLASVADKIIAAPGSAVGGLGKSIEIYRLGDTFRKFGIDWQVFAHGKYKTSFDWLSPQMSPAQKEMIEGIVNSTYRTMLTEIAGSRRIKLEKIKEIGDGMIFTSGTAEALGLVDKVGFFRDALAAAGELCQTKEEVKIVEPRQVEPEEAFFTQVNGVAVIEINGEIVSGQGGQNYLFGGTTAGSDKIARNIRKAVDDIFIKAIILRVDSPGGSPVGSGDIYQSIQYAREKKKVVIASMGSVAASGAYYVSSAADKIVADPSTVTGSIGVIGAFPTFFGLMKDYKAKADVVKEGAHADMFSGLRKFTPVEVKAINRLMDETYDDFVAKVAAGRKMPTAEVEKIAQGRVYTGEQALDAKLVDKLGAFSDAVDLAKQEAGLRGDVRLVFYRELNPFLQIGQGVSSALGLPPWKTGAGTALNLQYN